jgi:UDP-glucose 4-epimerase
MRVLVTGGAGFVGSHVADELSLAGHEVRLLDVRPSPFLRHDQEQVVGSITDEELVSQAISGCDVVYHFAGLADLDDARSRPIDSVTQNVLGTVIMLAAAQTAGVTRFVHASTIYVYSERGGFYRCSKQAAELYTEEYQRRYGMDFTILRFGTLYGPRADRRNSVHRLLDDALTTRQVRCEGTGDEMREYVSVKDAARLSVQILDAEFRNQHVIVTGPYPIRLRQLLEMIREIVGTDVEIHLDAQSGDSGHYALTPVTFSPKPGYKVTTTRYIDLAQGLLECLYEIHHAAASPAAETPGSPSPSS